MTIVTQESPMTECSEGKRVSFIHIGVLEVPHGPSPDPDVPETPGVYSDSWSRDLRGSTSSTSPQHIRKDERETKLEEALKSAATFGERRQIRAELRSIRDSKSYGPGSQASDQYPGSSASSSIQLNESISHTVTPSTRSANGEEISLIHKMLDETTDVSARRTLRAMIREIRRQKIEEETQRKDSATENKVFVSVNTSDSEDVNSHLDVTVADTEKVQVVSSRKSTKTTENVTLNDFIIDRQDSTRPDAIKRSNVCASTEGLINSITGMIPQINERNLQYSEKMSVNSTDLERRTTPDSSSGPKDLSRSNEDVPNVDSKTRCRKSSCIKLTGALTESTGTLAEGEDIPVIVQPLPATCDVIKGAQLVLESRVGNKGSLSSALWFRGPKPVVLQPPIITVYFDGSFASLKISHCTCEHGGRYGIRFDTSTASSEMSFCEVKVTDPNAPVQTSIAMAGTEVNIATCQDEELLTNMLNKTDNTEQRKQIRARLKEIRDVETRKTEERMKQRQADTTIDSVQWKAQMAEQDKMRRMKGYEEMAKKEDTGPQYDPIMAKKERSDQEKAAQMKQYDDLAKGGVSAGLYQERHEKVKQIERDCAEKQAQHQFKQFDDIHKNITVSNEKTAQNEADSSRSDLRPVSALPSCPARDVPDQHAAPSLGPRRVGVSRVMSDSWASKLAPFTRDQTPPPRFGGKQPTGARAAMSAFKHMDKASNPVGASTKPNFLGGGGAGGNVQRSPSTIKQMLLEWCKAMVKGYEGVNVTNFSGSWADGLAFCALIHHFHPESFDFSELKPQNRRYNFQLAFDTAEKVADIAPLLDVEDMVMMKTPDWKCVFTYVQSYYRKFRDHPANTCKPVKPADDAPPSPADKEPQAI